MYPALQLFIAGAWVEGGGGRRLPIFNPATEQVIGTLACADASDLDAAVLSASQGFAIWRWTPAIERARIILAAAGLLASRTDEVAKLILLEQGKPMAEARGEVVKGVELLQFFATAATQISGRVIAPRSPTSSQIVVKEPVGPVAAFTPWNFPLNQVIRKVGPALAAGCSIIVKAAEETPASAAALVQVFHEAGLPPGVLNLVYGDPPQISDRLIRHSSIRKVSFTGSTAVGKTLAALAGAQMKRVTMELGGHAPALVFDDADVERAAEILATNKYRNAGQSCISPTRILVQEGVYGRFLDAFRTRAERVVVGDGEDTASTMGPLINARRLTAIEGLVADAEALGARVACGGKRSGSPGHFFEATVLIEVPEQARLLSEEPFGPIAVVMPFRTREQAIAEANRLPYGLAAYAYTRSLETAQVVAAEVEAGMVSINHHGVGVPETPFGGVKDSGYGSEGGVEALNAYLVDKLVSQAFA